MNFTPSVPQPATEEDPILADLVETLTARLQSGEPVDLEEIAGEHLTYLPTLRSLQPILQALGSAAKITEPELTPNAPDGNAAALPFRQLGDYRLVREIGRGGMGVVYEAEQVSLGRRVALKLLSVAAALDPRHRQRFLHEAQAAARLHHSHIIPVFAVGCELGVYFYAMQFIEGRTLSDWIEELRLEMNRGAAAQTDQETRAHERSRTAPAIRSSQTDATALLSGSCKSSSFFRTVARLGIEAAEALDDAHQMGVVHRDVKPANLLLDERDHLWIGDFGLARIQTDSGLTQSGDLLGTLRYMSPEQVLAKRGLVDHRTDVYSLGITLYELLTLQTPYAANERQELLDQILNADPVSPGRLNEAVPTELETIVLKAIGKSPEERYASAQELADDLRRFLADRPIHARRPNLAERARKWLRRHRQVVRMVGLFAVLVIVGLSLGLVYLARERSEAELRGKQARQAVDEMYTEVAEKWLAAQPYLEPLQRDFLLKALAFYEDFSAHNAADRSASLEAARAARRVGDIERRLGESEKARAAYDQALSRLDALSAENPDAADVQFELATLQNHRGDLFRLAHSLNDARLALQHAESIFRNLAEQAALRHEYQFGLATSANNLAQVLHALNQDDAAESANREALRIFQELTATQPEEAVNRHFLAVVHANLAALLRERGRLLESEQESYVAISLWKNLLAANPRFPPYRQGQGVNYTNLGRVLDQLHRAKEAHMAYHLAARLLQELAAEFPSVPIYAEQMREARQLLELNERTP